MPDIHEDDFWDKDEEMERLEEEKVLELTKNEALYLSDSMTLLLEHTAEHGKVHIPARQLMPQAGVPVPLELIFGDAPANNLRSVIAISYLSMLQCHRHP